MMMAVIQEVTDSAKSDVIFRWATLLTVQGVMFVGMILGYLSTRSKVSEVGHQATTAVEQTVNTGNGFAKDVQDALTEIKAGLIRVEVKVDTHIQDHARVSLRKNDE